MVKIVGTTFVEKSVVYAVFAPKVNFKTLLRVSVIYMCAMCICECAVYACSVCVPARYHRQNIASKKKQKEDKCQQKNSTQFEQKNCQIVFRDFVAVVVDDGDW